MIGALAARHGTRFIDRGQLRGLPAIVHDLAGALRSGRSIAVLPEGTTWCDGAGHDGGRFRRATFQAALDAGAPIQPVTIEYFQGAKPGTVAAFVGNDTLLASLRRVVRARDLRIQITAQPALNPVEDRRELAARAPASIRQVAHV